MSLSCPQFKSIKRSKLSKRYYFHEETYPIIMDRPSVHALGHNSLVTIQKRVLPELQWYIPLQHLTVSLFESFTQDGSQSDSTINSDRSPRLYLSIDGWLLALVCWPLLSLKLWDFYALSYTYYRNSIVE